MASSAETSWTTLKPYYFNVAMGAEITSRSGANVTVKFTAWIQSIKGAWYQDNYHIKFSAYVGSSKSTIEFTSASANKTAKKTWTVTVNVGYASGSIKCGYTATQSWSGSYSASQSVTLTYASTYTKPSPPSISGYSSSNGYQESLSFAHNGGGAAALNSWILQSASLTDSSGSWGTTANNPSSPWSTAGTNNGAIITRRIATNAVNGGWQYSPTVLILQAPTAPSGFSAVKNTTFGATFSWKNNHSKTDYYTYIYEGTVSRASNGKLSVGSAKLLATLSPGVSSWGSASLWSTTGGQSTKTFTLVQVSSYAAWKRSDKASFRTSNRCLEGFCSTVLTVKLTNGAMAPSAATGVSAANVVKDDGKVSNVKATISFSAVASTADRPRSGWRIYDSFGNLLKTVQDSSAGKKSYEVDVPSMAGKAVSFTVTAYGDGGTSQAVSNTIYGQLLAPIGLSGSRSGSSISLSATAPSGQYASHVEISFSYDGEEWIASSGSSVKVSGSSYRTDELLWRARMVPDGQPASSHASDYVSAKVTSGTRPVGELTIQQDNKPQDGSHCVVIWNQVKAADGSEMPDWYEVWAETSEGSRKLATVEASGKASYSYSFLSMAAEEVKVSVIAVKNGWSADPSVAWYAYNPQYLEPPVLTGVEHIGGYDYRISFEPASGGVQYDGGTDDAGYMYSAYIDGIRASYQDPPAAQIIPNKGDSHSLVVRIVSPRTVFVRIAATDERKRSVLSNSVSVQHQMPGVGMFSYGCPSVRMEDCIIEGMKTAVMCAGGSKSSLEGCTVRMADGGRYYEIESGSSVTEINCTYE